MILDYIIIGIYSLALLVILLYSLAQLQLVLNYKKAKQQVSQNTIEPQEWPTVNIQLPLWPQRLGCVLFQEKNLHTCVDSGS